MNDDRDVDRLLHEGGARWRSGVKVDLHVEDVRFRAHSERHRIGQLAAAAGSVAVIAAVFAVVIGLRLAPVSPSASQIAGTQPVDSQTPIGTSEARESPWPAVDTTPYLSVVYPGDRVMASGTLGRQNDKTYLCPTVLLGIEGGLGCMSTGLVLVWGAEGWEGEDVQLEGTWDGDELTSTVVSAGPPPARPTRPPIPCDPPAGGWPETPTSVDSDAAVAALQAEVDDHPSRYVGLWGASNKDSTGAVSNRAVVVGTVEDVQSVTAALTAIYPFSLCVVASDFSAADLQPIAAELKDLDFPWQVDLEAQVGRVEVWTTALSPAMAEALAQFSSKVALHTTLRPSTSPSADPEEPLLRVIVAVNADPINFGGVYIQRGGPSDGELVIQYVGSNAGRAAVEARITPGIAVRWEKVDYSRSELRRIAEAIKDLNLQGVFSISAGSIENRVVVKVGATGSVGEVSQLLASKFGEAVRVEFSTDIPLIQPGFGSASP